MEAKLGSVSVNSTNNTVTMLLPCVDAERNIHLIKRKISITEWISATKKRLEILPAVMKHIHASFEECGIKKKEYCIYLYGSLARGQCRGSEDKPWYSSDIDLAICDSGKKLGDSVSRKILNTIYHLKFEELTDIQINVGVPQEHFDLIHSIKLH